MDMEKLNGSGYFDPTAYAALKRIERERKQRNNYRPRVFICSPYERDDGTNASNAKEYCRFAIREGYSPYCPHLFFDQLLNDEDPIEQDLGLRMGMIFLDCCSQVWVFGEDITEGMAKEMNRAMRYSKPLRFFSKDCKEVDRGNA